ncbi:MAG: hypothetical protein U1F70_07240 [Candidatus Competibacteraceae bacterium]
MSTTIGQILDNFFSPFSVESLWVMPETDNYTTIVRRWQPVIDAVNQAKANLAANCPLWKTSHKTSASWKPGKTDPPATDPNAYSIWVSSPPGTDPDTCRDAFIVYAGSVAARAAARALGGVIPPLTSIPLPTVQTWELYTCSIGSFGISATVDSIDCAAKTAKMNIWMYNVMSKKSFGRFASHPAFAASGMKNQYMWWNWSESHAWGSGSTAGGGPGGPGHGTVDW